MDSFSDRVVVITGGASGIGNAMARAFAEQGAKLVLADRNEEALSIAEKELAASGSEVLAVPTDVTELDSVQALASKVYDRFGAAHVVCNNAGVSIVGEMASAPHSDWKFVMDVNFWGVVHGVEAFAPRLIEQGEGHIVNTASMAGLVGMSWLGIYAASKFAVVGLSESLVRELKPKGVGVSVLCPMIVDTPINQNSLKQRAQQRGETAPEFPKAAEDDMKGGVIEPEFVAQRVLRAIRRGDLYILTHPEQRDFLRRRCHRIDGMFESWDD